MDNSCILTVEAHSSPFLCPEDFSNGIKVYIERPHLINPKVLAAEPLKKLFNVNVNAEVLAILTKEDFCLKEVSDIFIKNGAVFSTSEVSKSVDNKDISKNSVIFRNLCPRKINIFKEVLEIVILDHSEGSASFFPKKSDVLKSPIAPAFPYKFTLLKNGIKLEMLHSTFKDSRCVASMQWLEKKVLPKILKWSLDIPNYPIVPSINLLSAKEYSMNLHYLKSKYAEKFLKIWNDYSNTDPKKYVYEDISIAAYLITLWAQERKLKNLTKKQTFIDLGCGNGLLDHILSSEGHKGIGIDLKKRKIWDIYGHETNLEERVIEPNDKDRYPEYDWIIGNHADELTPWIPVIAARSSYNMRVFLLPCCYFTFDGKYGRKTNLESQYQSYLNFLHSLCTNMGFQVQFDKLRIPSTKRTCLICSGRTYEKEIECEIEKGRVEFINSHLKKTEGSFPVSMWDESEFMCKTDPSWAPNFVAREPIEKVLNCSQISKEVIEKAVKFIVGHLLSKENPVLVQREGNTFLWNKGGKLNLSELCYFIQPDVLKSLKSQNGGIQTLLRNHSYIFEVSNNIVQLRMPSEEPSNIKPPKKGRRRCIQRKEGKQNKYKSKKCFFHFNHPQGCPLSSSKCSFSHENM